VGALGEAGSASATVATGGAISTHTPSSVGLFATLVLLTAPGPAHADEQQTVVIEDTFLAESAHWTGGTVSDGVLALDEVGATVDVTAARTLSARLVLRQRDAAELELTIEGRGPTSLASVSWAADFADGGGIRFSGASGDEEIHPFPRAHRSWRTDPEPALEADPADPWEAGSLLHSEVVRDPTRGTWFLFYTGAMSPGYGYRQIGLATSPDGLRWTKHPDNPVITMDYSRETIDGVHAHMPTVVVDDDGTWHMFYACYQDDVGNRICHATSGDGLAWTRPDYGDGRMALDLGESGSFDDASVREPDVAIAQDGSFQMLYVGTREGEHYGPAGLARSTDGGWTWERVAQVTSAESELQGGSVVESAYGLEQWYQCGPNICFAESLPHEETGAIDWTDWTLYGDAPVVSPGWADWNQSYIQAPTVALAEDQRTLHMWFNANNYAVNVEVLGHARSTPLPDQWATLDLEWDGTELTVSFEGARPSSTRMDRLDSLTLTTTGVAELDEARLEWSEPVDDAADSGAGEDGGDGDGPGGDGDGPGGDGDDPGGDASARPSTDDADEGCSGCATHGSTSLIAAWLIVALAPLARRRG